MSEEFFGSLGKADANISNSMGPVNQARKQFMISGTS